MSYPKDLDEYTEEQLQQELSRREDLRQKGLCDYCARSPTTLSCKFMDRHLAARARVKLTDKRSDIAAAQDAGYINSEHADRFK